MDYQCLLLVLALYLFTMDFSESKRCNRNQYWEPNKGCKNCFNVCSGRRSVMECNFYCPNWGNIQNDKPKVPERLPIKPNNGKPKVSEDLPINPDGATETLVAVSVPIVLVVFALSLSLGGFFYWKRRAPNQNPASNANEAHQENDIRIPLNDINLDESCEDKSLHDTEIDESIEHENIADQDNQELTSDEEENAEDVDGLPSEVQVHGSQGSMQSIYELSKEVSGDADRDEPDYSNTVFCSQDQGGMRHAQLIMERMPNTELRIFDQPNTNEVNEEGREFEGATSSSAEPPVQQRFTRVSLHRASDGHQNQFFMQQESPAECLEETTTSAVQPSKEDTTQKYYINEQSNSEPYMSERRNEFQRPVPPGILPNGIDRYRHLDVNAIFAGAVYQHYDQTNDNDPPAT